MEREGERGVLCTVRGGGVAGDPSDAVPEGPRQGARDGEERDGVLQGHRQAAVGDFELIFGIGEVNVICEGRSHLGERGQPGRHDHQLGEDLPPE